MSSISNTVSLHPYFNIHPGKLEAARALLPAFVAKTATEAKCLYYDFTLNGETLSCREAYVGAEGALAHLDNVGELLGQMLKLADLVRLEIQGPPDELAKLKGPLGHLHPDWFNTLCGVAR